jgi:DNA polymerase III epsilon subunit-like protein
MKPDFIVFLDTETAGKDPRSARVVEFAWVVCDTSGKILIEETRLVQPDGFEIPAEATAIHGISTLEAKEEGEPLKDELEHFLRDSIPAGLVVGHNIAYDADLILAECSRAGIDCSRFSGMVRFCTMLGLMDFCAIPSPYSRHKFKFPKLSEAYTAVCRKQMIDCHDALVDTGACMEMFFSALDQGIFRYNESDPAITVEVCR